MTLSRISICTPRRLICPHLDLRLLVPRTLRKYTSVVDATLCFSKPRRDLVAEVAKIGTDLTRSQRPR